MLKYKLRRKVYHRDLFGLREDKYNWLKREFSQKMNYKKIKPESPYYFFISRKISNIKHYNKWISIKDIFPLHGVGMTTARDKFVIVSDGNRLFNRIRNFKNSKMEDEGLHKFFDINKKKGWGIRKAWELLQEIFDADLKDYIVDVSYRPFDDRKIFYHDAVVWRTAKKIMKHMLKNNIGFVTRRQQLSGMECNYFFISKNIISDGLIRSDNKGGESLFPLYIYNTDDNKSSGDGKNIMMVFEPQEKYINRTPNINNSLIKSLNKTYKKKISPEAVLYYIYGIFYSNIYRQKYAEFLKIDFPRIPFTSNYKLFKEISTLGERLAKLHLMDSKELDPPVARYQGEGGDRIEKIKYDERSGRIHINKDKYFEGVKPELWEYYIGGYRVLNKYLKDRKGQKLDDPPATIAGL